MDDALLHELMMMFFEEPPEVFSGAVEDMDEHDKIFFEGYVRGYIRGVEFAQMAIDDEDESRKNE